VERNENKLCSRVSLKEGREEKRKEKKKKMKGNGFLPNRKEVEGKEREEEKRKEEKRKEEIPFTFFSFLSLNELGNTAIVLRIAQRSPHHSTKSIKLS